MDFKQFASQGKYIKLTEVGDSIIVKVKVDPFTLTPREGKFRDPKTDQPKMVVDYVYEDLEGNEKIFTNGSQTFAQQMAKMKVNDTVKIVKIEKNGKSAYGVKRVAGESDKDSGLKDIPF